MKNRKRNRLQGYDYSGDNLYFVTICVKGRLCCFGNIFDGTGVVGTGRDLSARDISARDISARDISEPRIGEDSNQQMKLNAYGLIVKEKMQWLEAQYPYVMIHNFVVMPNHVHAIIEIVGMRRRGMRGDSSRGDSSRAVRTEIKIKWLSSLVGAFKTTSSKMIHEAGFLDFAWHRSFHDHIIRNENAYLNITNYIDDNPNRWFKDTFFEKG